MAVRWTVKMNRLPKIAADLMPRAEAAVAKAALDIQANAQTLAPVDTGFLRGSIQASKIGPAHWRVTVGADYGLFVEYGTVSTAPQPYFEPAIAIVWEPFQSAMRKVAR